MPIIRNFSSTEIHRVLDQEIDPDSPIAFYCQMLTLSNTGLRKKLDASSMTDLHRIRSIAETRLTSLLILQGWDLSALTAPTPLKETAPHEMPPES